MNPHTPKWASTLGVGVPMDFRIFKGRLQGSKLIGLKSSLYHQKVLETQMFKMGLPIDSRPLKVKNRSDLLTCRWRATYCWKSLDKGYNFALEFTSIGDLHKEYQAFKVAKVVILGISRFPTQES